MDRTTYGLDIAKSVMQLHWVDGETSEIGRRKLPRASLAEFNAQRQPARVVMEACGSAHHWARELGGLGHQVELLLARQVRAFVCGNEDDAADARAIWLVAQHSDIRRAPGKTVEQLAVFAAQTANEQHNYVLLAYSSLPQITARGNKLTLRVPSEFLDHIEPFARYTMERFGTKLVMEGADHDVLKVWATAMKSGWEKLGGTVVVENPMSYNGATDFYSGASKALAAKPDVLFVGGASEPTALVVKQARELGFKGGFIVMEQAKFDEMAWVTGGYGPLEGAIGVLPAFAETLPTTRLAKLYLDRVPAAEIMHNYAVMHATVRAMQLAGTATDPKAIRAQYDAAYKSPDPNLNLGRVKGVDATGGTLSLGRRAVIEGGKVVILESNPAVAGKN